MCAMRFICQEQHSMFMGKLGNTANVRTDTIVSRIIYQYRLCIRICQNCTFYCLYRHSQRNTQILIFARIHIDRNRTIYN